MSIKKIAIDARIYSKSTGTYVRNLLEELQDLDTEGYEFDVLLRHDDFNLWSPKSSNFRAVEADYQDFSFSEQIGFLKQLNSKNYDLVHFCMQQQPIFYRGKKVSTFHDLNLIKWKNPAKNKLIFSTKQLIARYAFLKSIRSAEHIITPSQYSADDIVMFSSIPEAKISVTYLAAEKRVDSDLLDKLIVPTDPFLLYVGNFFSYKNVETLGIALNNILDKHPNLKLVLVGRLDDAGHQLRAKFSKLNLKNIIFTGFISDAQRDALYEAATAYVFPSFMEGFGLPGLEAMSHGLPVISSNATCLPEVYKDAALFFEPSDSDELAATLSKIIENPQLRENLTSKGFKLLESYSWQKTAEETFEIYKKAIRG
ncbi:glycosyltransferase family 4 protein [Rothia nasimurium]|uniref:glycosyltransferase family 4 protein n=1 Tax=Rothia nasimurium TaxID=85336 RepID=UPI001F38037D|nr:glycosyltransferase family 1 protein [Rothia nasimurium]